MTKITLPNNWTPREYQRPLWNYLEGGGKRAYEIAHRRWGKDDVALHWAAVSMMQRVGNYWHMLPEAAQARKAVWEAVNPHTGKKRIDEAFPDAIFTKRHTDMLIRGPNGSTWQLVGSDNYNSLVGSPPIGVVFSEWALADPQAWTYIRPILTENGGWAVFITTPRGKNHAAKFYDYAKKSEDWYAEISGADKTQVFNAEQLAQELREMRAQYGEDEGEAKFMQEYHCSFDAAIAGSYYGKLINAMETEKRICSVPHNPGCSTITAWDLGYGDTTAIWFFQIVGKEPRLIDYYETSGQGIDHYVHLLREKPYNYETHVFPHDAMHGSLRTGKTLIDQVQDLGLKNCIALPREDIDPGVQLVRQLLPQLWIDETKCARGIDALRNYQRKWDEGRKVFSHKPLHDWSSNAADAARYLAVWFATQYRLPVAASQIKIPNFDSFGQQGDSGWMMG